MESPSVTAAKQQAVELLIHYTEHHVNTGRFAHGAVAKDPNIFLNAVKLQLDLIPEDPTSRQLDADQLLEVISSIMRYLIKNYGVMRNEIRTK